jgi:DNA-directed RNA polymerase subunit RPC12/RpoP
MIPILDSINLLPGEIGRFFTDFVAFFQAQPVPIQVLLGAMIVLSFILAGLIIYGVLWCVYQVIKGVILGAVVVAMLVGFGIGAIFMGIFAPRTVAPAWNCTSSAIRHVTWAFYPSKHGKRAIPASSSMMAASQVIVVQQHPAPEIVIQMNEPAPVAAETGSTQDYFCTSCGTKFSTKMRHILAERDVCFCEACGQTFTGQGGNPVPA